MTAPTAIAASIWATRELTDLAANGQLTVRRVYDLHKPEPGLLGLPPAMCIQGCKGGFPCPTRKLTATALMLPEA